MSENFAELFEASLSEIDMNPGAIVAGTVIDIDSDWVTVHAGLKSEGVIAKSEFLDEQGNFALEIGQIVKVALETVEDGFGATKLSREKAKRAESWMELEAAYEKNDIVTGIINGKVKGGFTVDLNNIRLTEDRVRVAYVRFAGERIDQGRSDALLIRRTSSGAPVWERSIDTGKEERLVNVLPMADGMLGTGWSFGEFGRQLLVIRRNADGF